MQGEFRVGMYAKITDVGNTNCDRIGYVMDVNETNADYDVLTLMWSDGTQCQ